jgi:Na+/alanine symporter
MKKAFVIGHWGLTLLLAPLTSQAFQSFWGTNPHQVVGLLEVYPITLLFSFAFSLPTFLVYLTCFYFLSRQDINFVISKVILIVVSVLGIYITQTIIKGTMSQDIIIAYSVTAIIVGLILRLRKPKPDKQNNGFAYDKI